MSSSTLDRPSVRRARAISHFEFWPAWLFYAPVVIQWILLGVRHGSMTLPTVANPSIDTGGLCGESKSSILDQIAVPARQFVAPYSVFTTGPDDRANAGRARQGLGWPLVLKPDIGCNGAGIRLVQDEAALDAALASYPRGVPVMLQRFIPDRGEAGIFYIRHPGDPVGRITSVTLKTAPEVVGDGVSTLEQLVRADERAGLLPQIYLPRLQQRLTTVPAPGEPVLLVFSGNHCKGSVFENGARLITPALTAAMDRFARGHPGLPFRPHRPPLRIGGGVAGGRGVHRDRGERCRVGSDPHLGCGLHPS